MTLVATPVKHMQRALRLVKSGLTPIEASRELAKKGIKVSKTRIYAAIEKDRKAASVKRRKAAPKKSPDLELDLDELEESATAEAPSDGDDRADDLRRINIEIARASRMARAAAAEGSLHRYSPVAKLLADLVGRRARLRPPSAADPDAERRRQEELAREVIGMLEQYLPEEERIEPQDVKL